MTEHMITITDQVEIGWFSFVNIINANCCSGKSKTRKQPKFNSVRKFLLKIDLDDQYLQSKANNKNKNKCRYHHATHSFFQIRVRHIELHKLCPPGTK